MAQPAVVQGRHQKNVPCLGPRAQFVQYWLKGGVHRANHSTHGFLAAALPCT